MPQQNENKRRDVTAQPRRSDSEIAVLTIAALSAIGAFAVLLIRLLLIDWPPYAAIPAGGLVGFVLISTLIIALGRTSTSLLATSIAVIIAVGLLWSLPERIRARRAQHTGRRHESLLPPQSLVPPVRPHRCPAAAG